MGSVLNGCCGCAEKRTWEGPKFWKFREKNKMSISTPENAENKFCIDIDSAHIHENTDLFSNLDLNSDRIKQNYSTVTPSIPSP